LPRVAKPIARVGAGLSAKAQFKNWYDRLSVRCSTISAQIASSSRSKRSFSSISTLSAACRSTSAGGDDLVDLLLVFVKEVSGVDV
jgi:hypothetical protein